MSDKTTRAGHSFSVSPNRYVRIKLAESIIGYSEEAIQTKIQRGIWLEGHEYIRAPDGNILINIEGFNLWAENRRRAG